MKTLTRIASNFAAWSKRNGVSLLFYAFSLVFFWYGALKIWGISPAEELVYESTNWIFPYEFLYFLGAWQVAIGICLFFPSLRPLGLFLLFLQFPGTFLPLITNPGDCFTVVPIGLTLEGQYIMKNLILIAGAIVLVGSLSSKN